MGAHLKRVREDKGVTRRALALSLGVHESAVTQWETGQTAPRLPHQTALREILGDPTLYTGIAA